LKATSSANIILIIAALMWSIGGLFIKMVDLSPIAITGTRSIAAALVFLVYLKRPQWYWNRYFVLGVLSYAAMMLLYVFSIRLTTAANAKHSSKSCNQICTDSHCPYVHRFYMISGLPIQGNVEHNLFICYIYNFWTTKKNHPNFG
tara:strand:+ start:308 stop:745 length:438 start_codon:yes stop_codon:yes gene_type:complete